MEIMKILQNVLQYLQKVNVNVIYSRHNTIFILKIQHKT
jgi:hypothetical protein